MIKDMTSTNNVPILFRLVFYSGLGSRKVFRGEWGLIGQWGQNEKVIKKNILCTVKYIGRSMQRMFLLTCKWQHLFLWGKTKREFIPHPPSFSCKIAYQVRLILNNLNLKITDVIFLFKRGNGLTRDHGWSITG